MYRDCIDNIITIIKMKIQSRTIPWISPVQYVPRSIYPGTIKAYLYGDPLRNPKSLSCLMGHRLMKDWATKVHRLMKDWAT